MSGLQPAGSSVCRNQAVGFADVLRQPAPVLMEMPGALRPEDLGTPMSARREAEILGGALALVGGAGGMYGTAGIGGVGGVGGLARGGSEVVAQADRMPVQSWPFVPGDTSRGSLGAATFGTINFGGYGSAGVGGGAGAVAAAGGDMSAPRDLVHNASLTKGGVGAATPSTQTMLSQVLQPHLQSSLLSGAGAGGASAWAGVGQHSLAGIGGGVSSLGLPSQVDTRIRHTHAHASRTGTRAHTRTHAKSEWGAGRASERVRKRVRVRTRQRRTFS